MSFSERPCELDRPGSSAKCANLGEAMFVRDQRVIIPNPHGDGRIAVRFLEVATDQPAEVSDPRVVGGKRMVDQAWIAYDNSTTALVPCFQIKADE